MSSFTPLAAIHEEYGRQTIYILASENTNVPGIDFIRVHRLPAVVFILMFVVCGYLLIYNIFDISVMQDVRQYGLLRTIGTSTRQIKSIVNRQAVWLHADRTVLLV